MENANMKKTKIIILSAILICLALIAIPKIYNPLVVSVLNSPDSIENYYGEFDVKDIQDQYDRNIEYNAYRILKFIPLKNDVFVVVCYDSGSFSRSTSLSLKIGDGWIQEVSGNE
jgi:hypothetical protein